VLGLAPGAVANSNNVFRLGVTGGLIGRAQLHAMEHRVGAHHARRGLLDGGPARRDCA